MGVRASTLVGRSVVDERLRGFTQYDEKRIETMLIAHRHDLGGRLALGPKHAIVLLRLPEGDTLPIFHEIFDTDKNGLVDAFELMSAVMMLSRMPIKAKVNRLHSLFDFNLSGELTIDELTIFFRTVAAACAKMDPNVKPPKIAALEDVTRWAFRKAARSTDGELTKLEFDRFVFTDPAIAHFLAYFNEASGQVLIADGDKFVDDGSPAYFDDGAPPAGLPGAGAALVWKRPEDFMMATPKLFKDETGFGSLVQGALGDSWFLSAVATLMASPNAIRKLFVATGQEDPEGRFALQFYRCGVATQVSIDDRLPLDVEGKPLFSRTDDPNELWLLLLEKAFAVHHGSYEQLGAAGTTADALRSLTGGGVTEERLAGVSPGAIWAKLLEWLADSMVGARVDWVAGERRKPRGNLLTGHCYAVVKAVEAGGRRMVKLMNPWKGGSPNGEWSYGAAQWGANPEVVQGCLYDPTDEIGFWVSLEEFADTFHSAFVVKTYDPSAWNAMRRGGSWPTTGGGGCLNGNGWPANPQFFLEMPAAGDCVVTASQDDLDGDLLSIGLAVVEYDFGADMGAVNKVANITTEAVRGVTKDFARAREVSLSLKLPEGRYAILPMTFAPSTLGGRVYVTTKASTPHTLLDENEILSREQPATGHSDHDQILLEAPPAPVAEEAPDQESVAVAALYELVGNMWATAHGLAADKRKKKNRLAALLRAVERKKQAALSTA